MRRRTRPVRLPQAAFIPLGQRTTSNTGEPLPLHLQACDQLVQLSIGERARVETRQRINRVAHLGENSTDRHVAMVPEGCDGVT